MQGVINTPRWLSYPAKIVIGSPCAMALRSRSVGTSSCPRAHIDRGVFKDSVQVDDSASMVQQPTSIVNTGLFLTSDVFYHKVDSP